MLNYEVNVNSIRMYVNRMYDCIQDILLSNSQNVDIDDEKTASLSLNNRGLNCGGLVIKTDFM